MSWFLDAERETWLLVGDGSATVGSLKLGQGDAAFMQPDRVDTRGGKRGVVTSAAYADDTPRAHLLLPSGRSDPEARSIGGLKPPAPSATLAATALPIAQSGSPS